MNVTLIYPPLSDPRAPQLALPSLAASLRQDGVAVDLIDLNVLGLHALLERESLEQSARALRDRGASASARDDQASRLIQLSDHLIAKGPESLRTLRDPEKFFDPHEFNSARDLFSSALSLAAAGLNPALDIGVLPIRYDLNGIDYRRLDHLIQATADPTSNLFREHWERYLYPRLRETRPDLVGITITNRQQILPALILARELRERGHFVVLGGAVYTKFVQQLQKRPEFFAFFADAVVVYEGETALRELLCQVTGRREFHDVPNLLYPAGGTVRFTRPQVEDIRLLPTPDFAGLPLESYLAPFPVLPILYGKGCYYNQCKFCDIPFINHISPKPYRVLSADRVVQDVGRLAERFNCRHFIITDEALSPKLLANLAESFEARGGGNYHFTGYARLEAGFTGDVFAKLKRMGMRKLFFGLESGSQQTQDHMSKGINVGDAGRVLGLCRDADIAFHLFSIIGFPEEDETRARETYSFFIENQTAIDHPANSFDIHPFGLELRTPYFDERDLLGLEVAPEVLDHDFVIGLCEGEWTNSRGLTSKAVTRLLDEFQEGLRQRFATYHNAPIHLWPGFEEYAVLYGSRAMMPFPFRTSLPREEDAPRAFRLRWNPAWLRDERAGGVRYVGLNSSIAVPPQLEEWVSPLSPPWENLSAGDRLRLRRVAHLMFGAGLLQMKYSADIS